MAAQKERLRIHGFEAGQGAADVDFIWENWIDEREKERVARVEMLDEVEEWRMLVAFDAIRPALGKDLEASSPTKLS